MFLYLLSVHVCVHRNLIVKSFFGELIFNGLRTEWISLGGLEMMHIIRSSVTLNYIAIGLKPPTPRASRRAVWV